MSSLRIILLVSVFGLTACEKTPDVEHAHAHTQTESKNESTVSGTAPVWTLTLLTLIFPSSRKSLQANVEKNTIEIQNNSIAGSLSDVRTTHVRADFI